VKIKGVRPNFATGEPLFAQARGRSLPKFFAHGPQR
jgi:hypothetical protein